MPYVGALNFTRGRRWPHTTTVTWCPGRKSWHVFTTRAAANCATGRRVIHVMRQHQNNSTDVAQTDAMHRHVARLDIQSRQHMRGRHRRCGEHKDCCRLHCYRLSSRPLQPLSSNATATATAVTAAAVTIAAPASFAVLTATAADATAVTTARTALSASPRATVQVGNTAADPQRCDGGGRHGEAESTCQRDQRQLT